MVQLSFRISDGPWGGGYGQLEVMCDRCETLASLHWTPSATAGNADLEVKAALMPVVPGAAGLVLRCTLTKERSHLTPVPSPMMIGEF
jgi:hypothetical protein